MLDIALGVIVNFLTLSLIFIGWKVVGSVNRKSISTVQNLTRSGERSAHSNLSLVTIGLAAYFIYPLLLVGVRWSAFGKDLPFNGLLHVLGFLLTGVVSYLYFIRASRGETK